MLQKRDRWLLAASLVIAATTASPVAAQGDRTEQPFAVTSRGRPEPREARSVVVLRDSLPAPAPPATKTQAGAGRTPPPAADAAPVAAKVVPARPAEAKPASRREDVDRVTAVETRGDSGAERGPPRVTSRKGAERTHEVGWGETWYGIARKLGVTPRALVLANPDVDPERLAAGTVLRVPGSTVASPPPPAKRRVHRVTEGESLWGIARKYGVTSEAVRKANEMKNDRVRIGETLVIPAAEDDDR